jgi:hypothetical protein
LTKNSTAETSIAIPTTELSKTTEQKMKERISDNDRMWDVCIWSLAWGWTLVSVLWGVATA